MTILWMDGFDHYSPKTTGEKKMGIGIAFTFKNKGKIHVAEIEIESNNLVRFYIDSKIKDVSQAGVSVYEFEDLGQTGNSINSDNAPAQPTNITEAAQTPTNWNNWWDEVDAAVLQTVAQAPLMEPDGV